MTPHILDRDRLIVEHYDGGQIRDNRIYIFRFYDNIFVKRLVLNLDQIIVISDNEKYQQRIIERSEADNFEIIGRIVGIFRTEY
jgi:phage repressor protein C with HTH and peptisase S24 domain